VDGSRYRFELHVDACFLAGLLDNRLGLLARRIDRGLKDELQPLAILAADAIGSALPARSIEQLAGLVDIELPVGIFGNEALRRIDVISRRSSAAPVNMGLHRGAVDEETQRLADRRIAEQRVPSLRIGALAVDLGPRVAAVELDVLDIGARHEF